MEFSSSMDHMQHGNEMAMRRRSSTRGHEAALRAVQKPPAKPGRAGNGLAPALTPAKVYRVEPREFRDLVQRLTGAPATRRPQRAAVAPTQPVAVRVDAVGQMYAPWCPFPLMAPGANMHPGLDGHQVT